jgi:hypothetical protein
MEDVVEILEIAELIAITGSDIDGSRFAGPGPFAYPPAPPASDAKIEGEPGIAITGGDEPDIAITGSDLADQRFDRRLAWVDGNDEAASPDREQTASLRRTGFLIITGGFSAFAL